MPDACIGVDVIVGFPGESEDNFQETSELLNQLDVSYLHVFSYSQRDNTDAVKMEPKVSQQTIAERSKILHRLSMKKKRQFYENNTGKIRQVLFETYEEGILSGHSENYISVSIKGNEDKVNQIIPVKLVRLEDGEILLLDNLRLCAEENYEFTPENAAKTIMVSRLSKLFDLCVLDSFPSAHRSHPSIVGFAQMLPACAGRIVEREVRNLDEIMTVAKAPHVIILGGSKVPDRLEAIKLLIQNGRADHVLLTGLIGNVFMRAQARIKSPLGIKREDDVVSKAHSLIGDYPDVFATPVDIAIDKDGERVEMDVREISKEDKIFDLGPKTIEYYSKLISGAGTVFISGPAGFFEKENFKYGTTQMLEAVANSMATTIVSGGHLTTALKQQGLADKINHISTAGGALVLYLTGEKLPMMKALENAAIKYRTK